MSPAPNGEIDAHSGETISTEAVPQWDEASRDSVTLAARGVVEAYTADRDQEQWWAQLQPLLTAQAAETYAYVDPANVPPARVTGPLTLTDQRSAYLGGVDVTTDLGVWHVMLTRSDANAPWLMVSITPPEGIH